MAAAGKKQQVQIEGRTVSLSNLDKPLYPSGFTKGQAIEYYIQIANHLLPHLKNRPVTLKRYPDGVEGKFFYEKNAPAFTPEWVRTTPVPRRGGTKTGDIHYIVIDDLPSLVWCVNAASLELHPFLHRTSRIDRPTSIVFDLDPGEGSDLSTCAKVAFLVKDALEESNVQSLAKVSGSKGIQIYVPLNTPITYSDTQPFAHSLAESMERKHPDLIVSKMAKALRPGKVFIDWSQNSDFKTTVSVYSLRAKSASPFVSMPVSWEELQSAQRKRDFAGLVFDPDAAAKRAQKMGDLFEPVLSLKQKLPGKAKAGPESRIRTPSARAR